MSAYSFVKKLCFISLLFVSAGMQAQMVKKIDCCKDINTKATIIINDNSASVGTGTSASTANASFNFELTSSVNTSAGVYNTDGNLVRTLWGGVRYDAGCYLGQWDGLLDDGTQAPYGNYTVKVLTNNVQYTWGLIGNTSTDLSGDFVMKQFPLDMSFSGNTGYMPVGYSEHGSTQKQFNISDPNKYTCALYAQTTQCSEHVWTDGNIVYWAGRDYSSGDNWIYGAYPSANCDPNAGIAHFSSGQDEYFSNGGVGSADYPYAISITKGGGLNSIGLITGMDGQVSGNYLFVARAGMNQLQVIDKHITSGATVQTLTYSSIWGVGCDRINHLYLTYNNALHKAAINNDGTLFDLGVSFSGLVNPQAIAVSPDGSVIAVADNYTKQVKFYSPLGGSPIYTLGQLGGYDSNPLAANDKFWKINFIKYQPDGSIWVGDTDYDANNNLGNSRAVHFNVDFTYKNQIQHIVGSRSTHIDPNDPTRYFADFLEFRRDYSKPLDNSTNGSWMFYANWGKNIQGFDIYQRFGQVLTLSNGRTYAYAGAQVYELNIRSGARPTGVYVQNNEKIGNDGTLFTVNNINNNQDQVTTRALSFDSNTNPLWATPVIFATSPITNNFKYTPASPYESNTGFTANSNKYIFFNNGTPDQPTTNNSTIDYHLASVKKGQNKYEWVTSRGTSTDYGGDFPSNGDWDVGNGYPLMHSSTHAMINNQDIIVPANNEFWKGGLENNIFNHFYDNGLLITQYGITGQKAALMGNTPPMLAGNNFGTDLARTTDGNLHTTASDESVHGAICIFDEIGENTIQEISFPLVLKQAVTIQSDPTNLMIGLPYRSSNITGSNGWSFNRTPDANFSAKTSVMNYTKNNIDLLVSGSSNSESYVMRSLGNNNTNNYLLTGKVAWLANKSYENYQGVRFQVLDINNKILADLNVVVMNGTYSQNVQINGNTVQSCYEYLAPSKFIQLLQPFSMTNANGQVTFSYAGYSTRLNTPYESGGDFTKPANFKIKVFSGNAQLDVSELSFSSN